MVFVPRGILVTGGAGFIASHVTHALLQKYPIPIVVLDSLTYSSSLQNLEQCKEFGDRFHFIKGDIQSRDLVAHIIQFYGIDTLFHFAAETHVDHSFADSSPFIYSNVMGTCALLDVCKTMGEKIKRFVMVSTDEVYGESERGRENERELVDPFDETSKLCPTNPYSATKAGAEMLCLAYARSFHVPVIITRGNNVYGPHQFPEKLIPKCITHIMCGKKIPIHGNGQALRSFLYIDDAVRAFLTILEKGSIREIYNIGSEDEITILDTVKTIHELSFTHLNIEFVKDRAFNDRRYYISSRKLQELGWTQSVSWHDGLRKTIEWYNGGREEKK